MPTAPSYCCVFSPLENGWTHRNNGRRQRVTGQQPLLLRLRGRIVQVEIRPEGRLQGFKQSPRPTHKTRHQGIDHKEEGSRSRMLPSI